MRTEQDMLGALELADDCPWGIHTERARRNFRVSARRVPPALVAAYAEVKKACCLANAELGDLSPAVADAIVSACDRIAAGDLAEAFPLDALQGGAGTSTNMNLNEVIARLATATLRDTAPSDAPVDPLAHVNLRQSTNDTYPTALRLAAIRGVRTLSAALAALQGALQEQEKACADIVTIGRTETVDAVPMVLGAVFGGCAESVARDRWRTFKCEERLRVVNLGGTAVGTGLGAPRRYIFLVIETLRAVTGLGLTRAENLPGETAHADPFVEVSGILDAAAATLGKIADDLRRLQAHGDIRLAPVQAGSSIMPGKVNPVLPECVIQCGMAVRANHGIIAECASRGSLQINEFLPLLGTALLESLELLAAAAAALQRCVTDLAADAARCREHAEHSTALITAFVPHIGYARCAALAESAAARDGRSVRAFLARELGEALVARVLSPQSLLQLGSP
jgi:aspartate ammonia-lyase